MTRHELTTSSCLLRINRIFPGALLPVLMAGSILAQPRPLVEYRFEEGSGLSVANSGSVSGGTGTLQEGKSAGNGPRFSGDIPQGISSKFSLQFDGVNDLVRIPDAFDYTVDGRRGSTPLSQLTIEAWVKPTALGKRAQWTIWDDYGNPGLYLAIYDDVAQVSISTGQHPQGIGNFSGKLSVGVWQHVAAVYDGTRVKLYIDGEDTGASTATSGPIQDNSTPHPQTALIAIGNDNEVIPALSYAGLIDDVRIFGVALTRDQLAGGAFAGRPAAGNGISYTLNDRGASSLITSGASPDVGVGYGRLEPGTNYAAPVGLAMFGFRQNGVLVTEAGVQASRLIQAGRIPAFVEGPLNTGIAIANPFSQDVTVSFFFTDQNGSNSKSGTLVIPAYQHIARFLTEAPFNSGSSFQGAFTFTSSGPVAAIALRGLQNERGEFLLTTLPVVDLNATRADPLVVPHFADGGGWTTEILLINPGDAACAGTVQFYDQGSTGTPAKVIPVRIDGTSNTIFPYSIPGRSARRLKTSDPDSALKAGSVLVTPNAGNIAPTVLVVFSLHSGGITVTEAGVLSVRAGTAFRMYVEAAGSFGEPGSIQSGFAVSNPAASPVSVLFELANLTGISTGKSATLELPARGQIAMFLNQIKGFEGLPSSFKGALRISTNAATGLVVTGLRSRFNERNEFLVTTTAAADEASAPSTSELFFPQIADGGGYTTQIILLNGLPGQVLAGRIRFFSSSGLPLNLRFP